MIWRHAKGVAGRHGPVSDAEGHRGCAVAIFALQTGDPVAWFWWSHVGGGSTTVNQIIDLAFPAAKHAPVPFAGSGLILPQIMVAGSFFEGTDITLPRVSSYYPRRNTALFLL
jgi:hypothetical protein